MQYWSFLPSVDIHALHHLGSRNTVSPLYSGNRNCSSLHSSLLLLQSQGKEESSEHCVICHAKTKWFVAFGCQHRCCKRRSSASPMGSVQVTAPFLFTVLTCADAHGDSGLWEAVYTVIDWLLAFVISKPKDGGFSVLGCATTCTFSCSICKRTAGPNLCLSPGSPWVHFRRCSPGLVWLYYRANLSWLFQAWLFLWKLVCCN